MNWNMGKNNLYVFLVLLCAFACKTPEARKPVASKSGSFIQESVKRNKKLVAQEEKIISDIIKTDTTNNYISSSNGFWYYYQDQNIEDTLTPHFGDLVEFEYNISTLEGNPIYTKQEIGKREYVIDKENVFNGLRQGLKLMKVGETVTFLFPSHKAFGYYGDLDKIGRNVPIRSTITLNSITLEKNQYKP
ncbi:gliding motility-associated peptidyl-prolyl isomerase [Mesonia algae]|uniref:Peptidyl-prolyl cis-trans isomerase n=1 Tax=Mesonia algae TaxID=213248 RepID=A0A2W7I184_9FLAO|nr:gliding motility-associated peptidyl-prolyl isomerase GldI [Mesonia algae]PZW40691.1 gliding motility-associated peptidyl-prolyl isomerase [Mesonia algae]